MAHAHGKAEYEVALEAAKTFSHSYLKKRDFDTMRSVLHDDFRCTVHGDPDIGPLFGTWDKDSFLECLKTHWVEAFGEVKLVDDEFIAQGNKVVQFTHWSSTHKREQPFKMISITKYVVDHGLIRSMDCHMDNYVVQKEGFTPHHHRS